MRNILTDVSVSFSENRLFRVSQICFSCGPQTEFVDLPPVVSDNKNRSLFFASQREHTNVFKFRMVAGDEITNLGGLLLYDHPSPPF